MSTLCSKCPFFQFAPLIKRKNARKRCRIEPQRTLRIYKCSDYPKEKKHHYVVADFGGFAEASKQLGE